MAYKMENYFLKKQLRINDLTVLLGVSRTTLWRITSDKKRGFPKGRHISERIQVWDSDEIQQWLNPTGKQEVSQ